MRYAIITDRAVASLYGSSVVDVFQSLGLTAALFTIPAGERSKSLTFYDHLLSQLASQQYGKDTTIVALGGGVITDLAGFIASTFCRGVPFILIPTTLLAMVDAAIGGKTAINLPEGKNLVGSYYTPDQIFLIFSFLDTLPDQEWENGIVEILKMGLISNRTLFELALKMPLSQMVFQAIEGKRRIVAQDVHEKGRREILNFGHTIGHAIEALSHYTIPHGKAVACGIVLESRLSHALGLLPAEELEVIEERLPLVELPFAPEQVIQQLDFDKKTKRGVPHFVLLKAIGEPYIHDNRFSHPVPEEILVKVLYDAHLCSC